jgi:hypothetical protein
MAEAPFGNSILSVTDAEEHSFRRGFQHGAQAALLATRYAKLPFSHLSVQKWIDIRLLNWRVSNATERREPPGPDGKPWPFMYPKE